MLSLSQLSQALLQAFRQCRKPQSQPQLTRHPRVVHPCQQGQARDKADGEVKLTVLQGADVKTLVLKAVDRMATMKKPAGI